MKKSTLVFLSLILVQPSLYAQVQRNFVDFEDAEAFGGDDAVIPDSYFQSRGFNFSAVAGSSAATATDVTFSFEKTGRDNTDGFWNNKTRRDEADFGDLGNYFLKAGTGNLEYNKAKYFKLSVDYTEPTWRAAAEVWDIDGPEQYQVTAYDTNGNEIGSLTSPQGGLNGGPWYWRFDAVSEDAKIAKVEIEAIGSKTLRGFAFDNFEAHPAPLPAAFPLGLACMSVLVVRRRKQRKARQDS